MVVSEVVTEGIIHAVRRYMPFPRYRIFLFGSRVSGGATERSDYDVGVEAGQRIPMTVMAEIEGELEAIPILQGIDLVDFSLMEDDFSRRAKAEIEIIYEQ